MLDKIKINGTEVPRIQKAHMRVATPLNDSGFTAGKTIAPELVILRDASREGFAEGFQLITNETGRRNYIEVEVECIDPGQEGNTYVIKMSQAFIYKWNLYCTMQGDTILKNEEDSDINFDTDVVAEGGTLYFEKIVIRAGNTTVEAGGGSGTFEVKEFQD